MKACKGMYIFKTNYYRCLL